MSDLSKSRLRMLIDGQTIGAAILFHISVRVCRARHLRALNRHRSIDVNKLCDDIIATSRGILCVGMTYGLFLPTYFCLVFRYYYPMNNFEKNLWTFPKYIIELNIFFR